MALEDCIVKALKARKITEEQAKRIRELTAGGGDERAFLESFIQEASEKKRRTNLQVIAWERNMKDIASHPKGTARGVLGLLVHDVGAKYSNVDVRRLAILSEFHGMLADAMSRYRTRNLGFSQDIGAVKRMVVELFGEDSGDADAKAFAKMWRETAEAARLRFNIAGGYIPKRKDWGLPHLHDARRIASVSFEEWRDYIVPRLDRRRMYNNLGMPMSQKEFQDLITGLYDRFYNQAKTVGTPTDRNVPNGPDHRLLTYKNSEAWLQYNERFGRSDVWHTMLEHLDHMAGDTALLEILGPNPDAAIEQMVKMASGSATAYKPTFWNRLVRTGESARIRQIRDIYQVVTGRVNQTEHEFLASFSSAVRNWLSASQLGSALISSFADLWTARMTAQFNGISTVKFLGEMTKLIAPGAEEGRIAAVKLGLGAEAWISRALQGERFGEISGRGLSARLSEATYRAGLLSTWTAAGKWAFGTELLGFVADQVKRGFKDLPEALRNSFERYGVTESHWNIIRQAALIDRDGAKFLRPADILELGRDKVKGLSEVFGTAVSDIEAEAALRGSREGALGRRIAAGGEKAQKLIDEVRLIRDAANKMQELVQTEMRFAFVEPDARIRAMWTQGQKRGSIMGEIGRSVGLFKAFPTAIIATHLLRGATELTGLARARYLSELMLGLTVMGAASVQARNLVKGKDAQDMTDPKFWMQAFGQGGGLGIMTDFLFSEVNRFNKGWVNTLVGPVGDAIDDMRRLTLGNVQEYLEGKKTKFGRDIVTLAQKYTPGGNLWYTRLALQRLFWDQVLKASDPEAHQSFRRIMQAARKDYNLEYWWRPGETEPARGPDVSKIMGE